eukprot:Phypoly_transcript_16062.p1 GENE.Phypoly_transcript_16062~~Phypoly_transcript_16062.p1  ORF type:complete len:126 (+),score=15.06 Phypoly_transcript_16062:465-842(+)
MVSYSKDDLIAICGGEALGRALYNKIHPNAPPQAPQPGPSSVSRVRVSKIIRKYYNEEEAKKMLDAFTDEDFCTLNIAHHKESVLATAQALLAKKMYKKQRREKQIHYLLQFKDNWPGVPLQIYY